MDWYIYENNKNLCPQVLVRRPEEAETHTANGEGRRRSADPDHLGRRPHPRRWGSKCLFLHWPLRVKTLTDVFVTLVIAAAECAGRRGGRHCRGAGRRRSPGQPQGPAQQAQLGQPVHRGALPAGGCRVRL